MMSLMRFIGLVLLTSLLSSRLSSQELLPDTLGGQTVLRYDLYDDVEGCYVFLPSNTASAQKLGLVVFMHGYGALNPLNYGAWIESILAKGQAVIYPRYQRNLLIPSSSKFAHNAARGIRRGLHLIRAENLPIDTSSIIYVGHSYGGVLSSYMMAKQDSLGIPAAFGAVISAPGTAKLSGSRLESYREIAPEVQLLVVSHEGDDLVGDEFPRLLMGSTQQVYYKAWIHQQEEMYGAERLGQGHNECYALNEVFDSGYRNYTTRKALRRGKIDALDSLVYWKLSEEMLEARGQNRLHQVFQDCQSELELGAWSDGQPRSPLLLRFSESPQSLNPLPKGEETETSKPEGSSDPGRNLSTEVHLAN